MESWTLATWLFMAGQVIVPVLWFSLNYSFRGIMGLNQSSGADAILTLLIFDGVVLADSEAFRQVVRHADLAANIPTAHVIFMLAGLVSWTFALRYSEPSIHKAQEAASSTDGRTNQAFPWFIGWLLLATLIILHVSFYMLPAGQSNG